MLKNKKIQRIVIILLIIGCIFIYKNREEPYADPKEVKKYKDMYLEMFYSDETMVSKGELFDIRYINYDPDNLDNCALEIVQKGKVSIFDVTANIVLSNGEKVEVYFSKYAVPVEYTGNQLFGNAEVYHPQFDRIVTNDEERKLTYVIEDTGIDSQSLTIEILYKGVERHHVKYDEKKSRNILEEFFNKYFDNEIIYSEASERWFFAYYKDYRSQLKRESIESSQEFAYYVWKTCTDNNYFTPSYMFRVVVVDYCYIETETYETVKEQREKLKKIVYESKEYMNEYKELRSEAIDEIHSILNIHKEYNSTIDYKKENEDYSRLTESELTVEDFWKYVEEYLR